MLLSFFKQIKKRVMLFFGYLKKQEAMLFYGSLLSYFLAFISFLMCSVVDSWTLLKLFNILLLVFVLSGALFSGLFNYIHFFYNEDKK